MITLIERCLNGETAEWEEEMVADILEARTDGRAIITQLGDSSRDGLNRLEWQLDGSDQERVRVKYGSSGSVF